MNYLVFNVKGKKKIKKLNYKLVPEYRIKNSENKQILLINCESVY